MRQLASFLLLLCPLGAVAQAIESSTTQTIEEVMVNDFRIFGNILANLPVQTLSHAGMERLGIHDMGDALGRFAGAWVKDYGGIGGMKTIDIRGLGAGHTGVVYDGVQVDDCQSRQVDLSRFTLGSVSLISLQVSQDDNICQSAKLYASTGMTNINTLQGYTDRNSGSARRKTELSTAIRTGSYGLFSPSLLFHQQFSQLGIKAYRNHERADSVYASKLKNGVKTINERRNNSDIETWRREINLDHQFNDKQILKRKTYSFTSYRGLPGAVIYDNTYSAERLVGKDVFTQLFCKNRFSQRIKLKAAAKWNYSWSRYSDVPASGCREDIYRQQEAYLTAILWTEPLQRLHLFLVQDYAHNHLLMPLSQATSPTRNSLWTALAANCRVGQFTFSTSLLATNITEQVRFGNASDGFHRLSPASSLQWRVLQDLRFCPGYKDIFCTPTLNELHYTGIGNRRLDPEKSRLQNLSTTYSHTFNHTFQLSLTADGYFGNITDKTITVPKMFYWQMMNVSKVRQLGLDVSTNAKKRWDKDQILSVTGGYSMLNVTDRTNPIDIYYEHQVAYIPRHSGSVSSLLHTPWLDLSYGLLLMGEHYSLGYNIPNSRIAAFIDHSIMISRNMNFLKQELRLQFGLRNLGDKNYEVTRFCPIPGTNWRLSVGWKP